MKKRIIKFRAWDPELKYFIPDVYVSSGLYLNHFLNNSQLENRLILMEFTGLKDRNGKEIYEGDICKQTNPTNTRDLNKILLIEWVHDVEENTDAGFSISNGNAYKIIGNIYENPELLKNDNN